MICNYCATDTVSKTSEGGHEFYRCSNCGREGGTNLIGLPDTEHPIDQLRAWRRQQTREQAVAVAEPEPPPPGPVMRRPMRCSECGVPFGFTVTDDGREVAVPLCKCG